MAGLFLTQLNTRFTGTAQAWLSFYSTRLGVKKPPVPGGFFVFGPDAHYDRSTTPLLLNDHGPRPRQPLGPPARFTGIRLVRVKTADLEVLVLWLLETAGVTEPPHAGPGPLA